MNYLMNYKIFEKSSLTKLGIKDEIMKEIQINFEIDSKAKWKKISLKKDILKELKKDEKSFFIEIKNNDNVIVFVNNKKQYFKQYFKYEKDGWSSYRIDDREYLSLTQLSYLIDMNDDIYQLQNSDFKLKEKKVRNFEKETIKLETTTEKFKQHILKYFNSIMKRLYGKKYLNIMKKIAENLSKIDDNMNSKEVLKFLNDNKKLAQKAREYEKAKNNDDFLKLKQLQKQYNSLSIIDEYLINFEVHYSEEYNIHITIKDLIDEFGEMQIESAFIYYLYSNKFKKLKISKF